MLPQPRISPKVPLVSSAARTSKEVLPHPGGGGGATTPHLAPAGPGWLQRFRRVAPHGGGYLPEMDGLRTFAIGLVVLWHLRIAILDTASEPLLHTRGPLSWVVDKGWFGVQLFFAISGFILALPFARAHLHGKSRPRLADYYLRRLTRLEPPYILTLLVLLFVRACARDVTVRSLLPNLAASLLYVHNIVFDDVSSISGVAWSLEVEVQFYLLAPLLSSLFAVRSRLLRRGLFIGIGLAAVAAQVAVEARYGFHFRWAGTLPAQIQYFMIGMLLADLWLSDWQSKPSRSSFWDLGALAGLCLLGASLHAPEIGYRLGVLPAIFLLYAGALRGRLFNHLLQRPLVSTLGGMCYSTYLLHTTVIYLFYPALQSSALPSSYPLRFAIFFVPVTLSVIAVSGLFFVLVERPCMERDWPSRLALSVRRRLPAPMLRGAGSD